MRISSLVLVWFVTLAAYGAESRPDTSKGYHRKNIAVIGDTDSRKSPESYPNASDGEKYRAVGLVLCKDFSKPKEEQVVSSGTATLVENNQTIITAAHELIGRDGKFLTKIEHCYFVILSNSGQLISSSPLDPNWIARTKGVNSDELNEPQGVQNDWIVAKLQNPIENVTPFRVARANEELSVKSKIKICSFSHDLVDSRVKRCLSGTYHNNGSDHSAFKNSNVILHDIDTNQRSSGAPVFVEKIGTPTVFALHTRGECKDGHSEYNMNYCFNAGILFTDYFYKALNLIVEETGGSIYGPPKVQKTKFITPVPANPNRDVST